MIRNSMYTHKNLQRMSKQILNKAVYTSRSRVRVGRSSDEIDQLDGLAGGVTPKSHVNAKKS